MNTPHVAAGIRGNSFLENFRMNEMNFKVLPNIMLAVQITCRLRGRENLRCIVHTNVVFVGRNLVSTEEKS